MAKKAKQQYLGDTEPEYIQEIVTAAETYKFNGQIVTLVPGVEKVKVKAVEVDGKGIDE